MPDLTVVERVARRDDSRPGWAVWHVKHSPCCGANRVHVFEAACLEIQCECGAWIETPAMMRMVGGKPRG